MAFKHCEFKHLMVQHVSDLGGNEVMYFGHVHEGEAQTCSALAAEGWPDASDLVVL